MKHALSILAVFLLSPLLLSGQRQANVWIFGHRVHLDFNSGSPEQRSPVPLSTNEGTASIADPNTGELLFYTDGVTVWNRNHLPMAGPLPLKGGLSATQGAVIVPDPGDALRYYVFTADTRPDERPDPSHDGINYSVVDMRRAGSLGEIVTANVPLLDSATEKLVGVQHPNGRDYWVIAHEYESDRFFAWLVTDAGVSPPVVSVTGHVHGGERGHMKVSPDGRFLALVVSETGYTELLRFDHSNGTVSALLTLVDIPMKHWGLWGLSFSPGSCKLYVCEPTERDIWNKDFVADLYQYDVSSSDPELIRQSRKLITALDFGTVAPAFQIGPDGKIYLARDTHLGIIDNPDADGIACDYRPNAFTLSDGTFAALSLPNFVDGWFSRPCASPLAPFLRSADTVCPGGSVSFAVPWIDSLYRGASVAWSFPGGSPSASNARELSVSYATPGEYPVTVVYSWNGTTDTATGTVVASAPPVVEAFGDTVLCEGGTATLRATGATSYRWESSSPLSCDTCDELTVSPAPGSAIRYIVTGTNAAGCTDRDTVTVRVVWNPDADASADTTICAGGSARLRAYGFPVPDVRYRWEPAVSLSCDTCFAPVASPLRTTTYRVTVANAAGCVAVDSVTVTVVSAGGLAVSLDTAICAGASVRLSVAEQSGETGGTLTGVRWSPALGLSCDTCLTTDATPDRTTTYVVSALTGGECRAVDSVTVTVVPLPVADAGPDVRLCAGESVELTASGGTRYRWTPTDGLDCDTCQTIRATPERTTVYRVTVSNDRECVASDSVTVAVLPRPNVDAGTDVTICTGETARLTATGPPATGGTSYAWEPADGLTCLDCPEQDVTPTGTTTYRVTVTTADGCTATDAVTVTVQPFAELRFSIPTDLHALPGEEIAIPVRLDTDASGSGVTRFDVLFSFDPRIMQLEPGATIAGTLLDGWNVAETSRSGGTVSYRCEAVNGATLTGRGTLLVLRGRLYLGSVTEMPLELLVVPESSCVRFHATPGRARLDSICGLSFRLIESTGAKYSLSVSPNPASGRVSVMLGLGLDGRAVVDVFDGSGNHVAVLTDRVLSSGLYAVEWETAGVAAGTYWIRATSGDWSETRRVVVRH